MITALAAARDLVVEGQEPGSPEGQRMVGAERARTIYEDVDLFFDRHVLRLERVVGATMDAVIARVAEAVTGGDECEGAIRSILRWCMLRLTRYISVRAEYRRGPLHSGLTSSPKSAVRS